MGKPLRVLHAVVNMNRGGAETMMMNLYRHIDRSVVQFDFLTGKPGEFDDEIRSLGGVVHRVPYISEAGPLGYLRGLDRFFAANRQYRVIHAHMDRMSGFVLRAARRAGIPVRIAHSHNTSSEGGAAAKLFKRIAGSFIEPNASARFACSERAAEWLFRGKAGESRILKNGIDCAQYAFDARKRRAAREELGLAEGQLAVGHVGRFNRQKNHMFLLDIFGEVIRRRPDAVLLLCGDGTLREETARRADALGIAGSVRFLGVRPDVHRLLQAMDVLAFPSLHEGLPVTLVEAQAAGLPCIVSDAVTAETDLGLGLLRFISLKRPAGDWAEHVIASSVVRAVAADEQLRTRGYDARENAAWLESFYRGCIRV